MLPEFKLFLKGEHVGFERHRLIGCLLPLKIEIQHKRCNGEWMSIFQWDKSFGIIHDEKRQWTYRVDRNEKKIYEGDQVRFWNTILKMNEFYFVKLYDEGYWGLDYRPIMRFKDSEMEVVDE